MCIRFSESIDKNTDKIFWKTSRYFLLDIQQFFIGDV